MPVYLLSDEIIFPDPDEAEPTGLLAVGGDLSQERLLLAYRKGIFPWYSEGEPILWFSPDPRLIVDIKSYKPSRSLLKTVKTGNFKVMFDNKFEQVINRCSEVSRKGQTGTWINPDMIDAYINLHEKGYAHSVETYDDDELVGGLYGVSLGTAFFGESMFHTKTDASKVAYYTLVQRCVEWEFDFIDSQVPNDHMKKLGAIEISRTDFLSRLENVVRNETRLGKWK